MDFNTLYAHTDFDGVVSAALIKKMHNVKKVVFIEPYDIQNGTVKPGINDVVVDLPYCDCGLWFDHHPQKVDSNSMVWTIQSKNGSSYIPGAKSCAGVIFKKLDIKDPIIFENAKEVIDAADKIDSASLNVEDLNNPDFYSIISICIRSGDRARDDEFREFLVDNIMNFYIEDNDKGIFHVDSGFNTHLNQYILWRYERKKKMWAEAESVMMKHYNLITPKIAVIDMTDLDGDIPKFQLYNIYAKNMDVMFIITVQCIPNTELVKVSIGSNIFRKDDFAKLNIDIGKIMAVFEGGGHKAVGGCSLKKSEYKDVLNVFVDMLEGKK